MINVLSLFDGMSCGQLALKRAQIPVDNYFASEVDKHAIKVTTHNFPNTVQLGDIRDIDTNDLPDIDLLIGGSPCQGFSYAGKQLNFDDNRSKLFFKYIEMKDKLKPKYFLLENVVMKKEWQDIISDYMGCEPVEINSADFSAQNRKRLYWTNIPLSKIPTDRGVDWMDISDDGFYASAMRGRRLGIDGKRKDYDRSIKSIQYIESRMDNKTNCLTTVGKDTVCSEQKVKRIPAHSLKWRYMSRDELEKLQTLPVGYTNSVSISQCQKMVGNGWTVDVVAWIFGGLI
jgi:site-specific DNA-cytosine methylase